MRLRFFCAKVCLTALRGSGQPTRQVSEACGMGRIVQVASAQMGPISKSEPRKDTVRRLIALMREAKGRGAELVVFPELALTTFFPRWLLEDEVGRASCRERV